LGQPIEPGSAKHLALEPLQAVDLPFNGSLAPGQRHPGFHGGVILTPSFGKAPEGREGARGGARQPRIELGRLVLTDEAGEVLREGRRLCQYGRQFTRKYGVLANTSEAIISRKVFQSC